MINLWEAAQGLLFMATFGFLTRSACLRSLPAAESTALVVRPRIPAPRRSLEEEHGTLTLG